MRRSRSRSGPPFKAGHHPCPVQSGRAIHAPFERAHHAPFKADALEGDDGGAAHPLGLQCGRWSGFISGGRGFSTRGERHFGRKLGVSIPEFK